MKSQDWSVSIFFIIFLLIFNGVLSMILEFGVYVFVAYIAWILLGGKGSGKKSSSGVKGDSIKEVKENNLEAVTTTSIGG